MIPTLLYLLLKKYRHHNACLLAGKSDSTTIRKIIRVIISIAVCMAINIASSVTKGQQLHYNVLHNGSKIGWIKIEQTCDSQQYCRMILTSETKFRMLMSFNTSIVETAYFLKEKLVFSSQFHKTNGNIKTNKKTRFTGKGYELLENNTSRPLDVNDVKFNLMCMYFKEPVTIPKVYCDKQETFSVIEKSQDGGYLVRFPNGNSNCYYYRNGICYRVQIIHTFYTAEIVLNN